MSQDLPPPLDYEAVKDFFFDKLEKDRKGRGRMESALYHTAQWIFLQGCNRHVELLEELVKLENFKIYVHQRLDSMGVPHSVPESEHDKAGCRIGGRLDWVENEMKKEREISDKLVDALNWSVPYVNRIRDTEGLRQILAEVEAERKEK